MSDRAALELTLGSPSKGRRQPPDEPLRILFLAELSGETTGEPDFEPHRIAFETLDAAFRSLAPQASIALEAPLAINETVTFRDIDDFHPDALLRSLSAFRTLDILGARLGDPHTREDALTSLGELLGADVGGSSDETPNSGTSSENEDESQMMERLLGGSSGSSPQTRAQQKVESFIQNVMSETDIKKPSVTADVGNQQIDALKTDAMRAVLLSQPLRNLERAWRSLEWLMQRLDDQAVEIHAVDLPKDALATHLAANAEHLERSALHRLFCEPSAGKSWDFFVGDYSFSMDAGDLLMLTTLGAVAAQAGAPFLAHGDLGLCGCASLDQLDVPWDWQLPDDELGELWSQVRSHPAAQWIGLATPRILLRQAYGPDTDPIDGFEFRELPARPGHECFLWGNPALGCAYLVGRAHAEERDFSAAGDLEIEDLPAVLYDDGSGQALQPPVEALIGERAMNAIQTGGLIPMLGRRDSTAVRCADLTAVSTKVTRFID